MLNYLLFSSIVCAKVNVSVSSACLPDFALEKSATLAMQINRLKNLLERTSRQDAPLGPHSLHSCGAAAKHDAHDIEPRRKS